MKTLLRIEEAAMFLVSLLAFHYLDYSWWWFAGCILLPDLCMIGYAAGPSAGAYCYNLFHHKGIAVLVGIAGWLLPSDAVQLAGVILFAHASMDRIFGYGLKYKKGFQFTHLGVIGRNQFPSSST